MLDGVKELYYRIEDKYYAFLDSIEEHIPVYEIVDPIDKVFPSLVVFSLLFILLVALGGAAALGLLAEQKNDYVSVTVVGSDGKALEGASVVFSQGPETLGTSKTGKDGTAKQSGFKEGDKVLLRISKDTYETVEKNLVLSQVPYESTVQLQSEESATSDRTIRVVDSLGQPITSPVTITFKCSQAFAKTPDPIELGASDRGEATVKAPSNCGRLTASLSDGTKFREMPNYVVAGEQTTIRLQEAEQPKGTLTVSVVDSQNRGIDGIEVQIFKSDNGNIGPLDEAITSGGQAQFKQDPGNYVVKTYDRSGSFGEAERSVTITATESSSTSIILREEIKGKIKVKVVDKKSNAIVPNANVRLVFASDGRELTAQKTNSNGEAEFNISRDVEYRAIASAPGYQVKNVSGLKISTDTAQISLDKCTSTTCGTLRVKVVDQDDIPITNAVVALYNAATGKLADYGNAKTDINGLARFTKISAGKYSAFSFKGGFSGKSDSADFDGNGGSAIALTVKMDVGKSTVRVQVRGKEGVAVPFAKVSVFDSATNRTLAGPEFTDSNGIFETEMKANTRVYAVVEKSDEEVYTPYTTAKRSLATDSVETFDAVLEKPILDKKIEVSFEGLYSGAKKADKVEAGGKYTAKFKVRIPEEKDYDTVGMHVRTGDDVLMEKDELFLGEINAAKTSQIRASRFEPETSGIDVTDYDVTVDDAKWANLEWGSPRAGIYEVQAQVNVKDSASLGDKLALRYRVFGKNNDGTERDPADDTLTKEIYSNTKQEILEVGTVTLCDEGFCFTAAITDKDKDLLSSVTDTYNARIFNKYKMQFVVKNNSQSKIHNRATLRVTNLDKSVKFFDYEFLDAETKSRKGVVNGFEFPRLDVGDLLPDRSVRLDTDFIPQKAINGIINISLVSDQAVVFEKNITAVTSAASELDVALDKAFFSSGIATDVQVTVKDPATGVEIEDAIVRVRDKQDNVLDFDKTRKDGIATVTIPGQKPGEKLKIEIEKPNYNVKTIELTVSEQLLELTPSQIGISLNTKNKVESSDKISVKNAAPYDLTVKQVSLTGTFKKLIDTAKTRNWLENSYKGMAIKSGAKNEIIVKTFLSQDALALKKRETLDAELTIIAQSLGQEWIFKVPAKISVGLGDEVDDPTCLSVSRNEWTTSTSGPPKRIEFSIQNNCTVEGKPVSLQDLEAKIVWKTNQIGEFRLNIGADETILRSGYSKILLGTIQPEQTLASILSFTPYGGVNGTAEAEIVIDASNPLDDGDQVLENKIKAKITAVNLGECITYDKERVAINQKETGTITVTATEQCGQSVDFEIKSPLKTTPEEKFTLNPGQSKAIEVFAEQNNPGQYPLYVRPKFDDSVRTQLVKNLKVIINAPGCWQMSKYEFDVYNDPKNAFDGTDSAKLTNTCVERPVQVKVNTRDFMDALQDGIAWGAISAGLVMLTNWSDPNVDYLGRATDPNTGELLQKKPGTGTVSQTQYDAMKDTAADKINKANAADAKVKALEEQVKKNQAAQSDLDAARAAAAALAKERNDAITQRDALQKQLESQQPQNQAQAGSASGTASVANAWNYNGELYHTDATGALYNSSDQPVNNGELENEIKQLGTPTNNVVLIAPVTGNLLAITGYNNAISGGAASGAASGLAGGLLNGGKGLVRGIFGTSPLAAGLLGAVAGTLFEYMSQEKETTFTVLQKDAEVQNVRLVQGEGPAAQDDPKIRLQVQGLGQDKEDVSTVPQPLVNNPDLISQGIQNYKTVFTNDTGLVTSDEQPYYSNLWVQGTRHKYKDKTYDKENFFDETGGVVGFFDTSSLNKDKTNLEEDKGQSLEQTYKLEFNSVPPLLEVRQDQGLLNCQDGTRTGKTGIDALPKVKFDWSWSAIAQDACNEDNKDGVYCDATQFSISLLKKINSIDSFLSSNAAQFSCPSPREDKPAENDIGSFDVGIQSLSAVKDGVNVQVIATVKNTNPGVAGGSVTIKVKSLSDGKETACQTGPQNISVSSGGTQDVSCKFTALAQGFYTATASLSPSVSCEKCEDISATNTISRNFFAGESGLAQCDPYSTTRIADFMQASGIKNSQVVQLTSFNALLMGDGYSTDFQHDFDVASNNTFFQAPDFYTNKQAGLGAYFKDSKLFSFDAYSQPDFTLPGPGTYNVTIDITYKDNSWRLFDSKGNPNAKIVVRMEKLKGANPDSPFYYMPLDGLVGVPPLVDDSNHSGRIGYGVNFAGDSIVIDNNPEAVRTVDISGSSPIENGVVNVTKSKDFKSMQMDNRGVVAKLSRAQGDLSLLFQPSNATPVILGINKKSDGPAYAVYQVGVDGDAVDIGQQLTIWNGIGASCRSFDDQVMAQQIGLADTHGIGVRCSLVGQNARSKYALEFCADAVNHGNAYYESVFYTPQGSNSSVSLTDVSSEDTVLISSISGQRVPLNGNGVTSQINTLEDVFNLVNDEYVCVSGTNLNAEFFWNPKKLFTTIKAKEDEAINACIATPTIRSRQ